MGTEVAVLKNYRKALNDAIKNWWRRAQGCVVDDTCPICLVHGGGFFSNCEGCPVREFTGKSQCHDTPYWEWKDEMKRKGGWFHKNKSKETAQKEVDFLVMVAQTYVEPIAVVAPANKKGGK